MTNGDKIRSFTNKELATFLKLWVNTETQLDFWLEFLGNEANDAWWEALLKGESENG